MITTVAAVTAVVTAKVVLVEPAPIMMAVGTLAALLLVESVTAMPPVGAAAESVTVPVTVVPPDTDNWASDTDDSAVVVVAAVVESVQAAQTITPSATRAFNDCLAAAEFTRRQRCRSFERGLATRV